MANENILNVRLRGDLSELVSDMSTGTAIIKNFGRNVTQVVSEVQKSFQGFQGVGGNIIKNFDEIAAGAGVLSKVNASIDAAAASALQSGQPFQDFGAKVSAAIAQVTASGANITQVTQAINDAAAAALRAGDGFLAIGVKAPIQDINVLRANVNQLKADLASGFKASISVVDPKTPALLNSISASLTNIAPAINSSNAALQGASNSAKVFAVSVNKSLADAVSRFESFKAEALSLSGVFSNIPVTLRPDTKIGLEELRQTVSVLKKELSEASLTIPTPKITPPNLDATKRTFSDFNVVINRTLAESVKSFDAFKVEALELGSAFDKIPASLKPFNVSGITALRSAVSGLKKDVDGLKFQNIGTQFQNVNRAASATGTTLRNSVTPGAKAAGFALTDVGRILQDLPFGFVGIQNNLTQLPDSFKRLSLAAKESGQSMSSALLGALAGPAGIGIALSAVTAAVTFASVGFGAWEKIMGKSSKAAKEAADRTKEFLDSLKSSASITNEAFGSVEGQISQVSALAKAVTDSNKPYAERQRALEQLQQVNKSYFGDLTLEGNSLSTLAGKVNEYTKALVQQAVVKGFTDEITRVSTELRKQNAELDKAKTRMQQLQKTADLFKGKPLQQALSLGDRQIFREQTIDAKAANEAFVAQRDTVEKLSASFARLQGDMQGAVDESLKLKTLDPLKETAKNATKADAELVRLKQNFAEYSTQLKQLESLQKEGLLPTFKVDDLLTVRELVAETLREIDIREVVLKMKPRAEIDSTLVDLELKKHTEEFGRDIGSEIKVNIIPQPILNDTGFNARLREAFNKQENLNKRAVSGLTGITIPIDLTIDPTVKSNITSSFDRLLPPGFNQPMIDKLRLAGLAAGEAYTKSLSESLRDITSSEVANSIAALGEGLGSALTSGENPIQAAARSFLSVIGGVLQQVGKEIIIASKLVIVLKAALQKAFTNPAASLVAGIALVVAGSALKNIKFPKLAEGGITTGPTLALIGESGREAVLPLNRAGDFMGAGNQMKVVETKISGRDIVQVWKLETAAQNRLV